jgi:hypothetical protein
VREDVDVDVGVYLDGYPGKLKTTNEVPIRQYQHHTKTREKILHLVVSAYVPVWSREPSLLHDVFLRSWVAARQGGMRDERWIEMQMGDAQAGDCPNLKVTTVLHCIES